MQFKLKKFRTDISVSRMANLHYFEFVKEYHTFKDSHPFRELIYIDSGTMDVSAENFSGTLHSKQLIIHRADEPHSLSCPQNEAPNVIIIGFECDCKRLDKFANSAYTLSNELIKMLTEVIKEGRTVFLPPYDIPGQRDMKKRRDFPFGADQLLKMKFEMFLIELVRHTEAPPRTHKSVETDSKTEEIFSYVNNNFTEKITLDDLCFLFNTNKTSLCKAFKEVYGESAITYINRLRIKRAKELLRDGTMNLTEISAAVGFSSIHYFSRIFKSYESLSPTEYLNTIKLKLNM